MRRIFAKRCSDDKGFCLPIIANIGLVELHGFRVKRAKYLFSLLKIGLSQRQGADACGADGLILQCHQVWFCGRVKHFALQKDKFVEDDDFTARG